MQNKCNRGCSAGFVPASSNWDFNFTEKFRVRGSRGNSNCRQGCENQQDTRPQTNGSTNCADQQPRRAAPCAEAYEAAAVQGSSCPCAPREDDRAPQCCEQNTVLRGQNEPCNTCSASANAGYACTGLPNCTCAVCTRARANCGSYNPNPSYAANPGGCDAGNGYPYAACNVNSAVPANSAYNGCYGGRGNMEAMVEIDVQQLGETFASESALRAGTLFPELHKPLNGYCPCDSNCGTRQQAASFAAWELRLYLNTHPDDQQALALFRQLCREAGEDSYATAFLPDGCCGVTSWNWTNNPWPWEYQCQCGD